MSLVTQDFTCTGTGNASFTSQPTKVLSGSGTSVPKLLKLPARTLNASGTVVPRLLKIPGRVLFSVATHGITISLLRFGIDTFDIIEGRRKWIISALPNGWAISAKKRFTFLVRGKPYG